MTPEDLHGLAHLLLAIVVLLNTIYIFRLRHFVRELRGTFEQFTEAWSEFVKTLKLDRG